MICCLLPQPLAHTDMPPSPAFLHHPASSHTNSSQWQGGKKEERHPLPLPTPTLAERGPTPTGRACACFFPSSDVR